MKKAQRRDKDRLVPKKLSPTDELAVMQRLIERGVLVAASNRANLRARKIEAATLSGNVVVLWLAKKTTALDTA